MSGYVDLQVNGYAGVDFNADTVTNKQWTEVTERLKSDGVESFLPTIITAPWDRMIHRIKNIVTAIDELPDVAKLVSGIHVEGPFINPAEGFVGAHPPKAVKPAELDLSKRLVEIGDGKIRLVTLAPERDADAESTRWLADQGIVVAAGHSDASLDQLKQSIDAGLKLFTHLGNGCPGQMHRHDNIVQRVLSVSDKISVSLIADSHHIPVFALANYLDRIPDDNIVIVSDAICAAGLGPGDYKLAGQIVTVDQHGAAWSADRKHFAGSAATMPEMFRVLTERMAIDRRKVEKWMGENPGRLIGSPG